MAPHRLGSATWIYSKRKRERSRYGIHSVTVVTELGADAPG